MLLCISLSTTCVNKISPSCSGLLHTLLLQVSCWVACFIILLCNITSLIYHTTNNTEGKFISHFLSILNIIDALVGMYLLIIGTADNYIKDDFTYIETGWIPSALCRMTGCIFLFSVITSSSLNLILKGSF